MFNHEMFRREKKDLGKSKMEGQLQPGEQLHIIVSSTSTSPDEISADQMISELKQTGLYETVRAISYYNPKGELEKDTKMIVVKNKD